MGVAGEVFGGWTGVGFMGFTGAGVPVSLNTTMNNPAPSINTIIARTVIATKFVWWDFALLDLEPE